MLYNDIHMSISCQGSNHRFILTPDVTSSSIIICKVRSPNVILEPQRRELNVNDYTEVKHLLTYLFAYLFFSLYYQDFGIYIETECFTRNWFISVARQNRLRLARYSFKADVITGMSGSRRYVAVAQRR